MVIAEMGISYASNPEATRNRYTFERQSFLSLHS